MHTLPVPTWQLLASKLISVYIWFAAVFVVSGICSGIAFGEPLWFFKVINDFDGLVSELNAHLGEAETELLFKMVGYAAVCIVLAPVFAMSNIYLSFALGNLFSKSKLVMSVVMYFVIRFVEQVIGSVITMLVSADKFFLMINGSEADVPVSVVLDYMTETLNVSLIMSVICSAVYLIAAERIFSKKLNLE